MARINIYEIDELDGTKTLVGWFDPRRAERFDQDRRWDGNNMIGVITGSQWVDEYLYRTAGGRWVVNNDAHRYCNGPDVYEFITDEQARDWLLRSECNDDVIEKYFGELEDERGPGRPEIGQEVKVRLGDDQRTQVDELAVAAGVTRAEQLRRLIDAGLSVAARV